MFELTAATQCAILLTANWGPEAVFSLTSRKYSRFVRRMEERGVSADDLLGNPQLALTEELGDPTTVGLLQRGFGVFQNVSKWLNAGLWVASQDDELYPNRLRNQPDRPPILFGVGDPNRNADLAVAIVGSRNADADDLALASRIGAQCASENFAVVSGGARGVDQAAMQGAASEGGKVIGILPESLLKTAGRPESRQGVEDGNLCLWSETNPEAGFSVPMAMQRNRLLYACSDFGVIVQCEPDKGGTWAGASAARAKRKPVYVCETALAVKQLEGKGAMRLAGSDLESISALYERARAQTSAAEPEKQLDLFGELTG